jgi:hypothetical protein
MDWVEQQEDVRRSVLFSTIRPGDPQSPVRISMKVAAAALVAPAFDAAPRNR